MQKPSLNNILQNTRSFIITVVSLLCHVQRRINSYLIVIHGHLKLMALSIGNVYISKSRFKYSRALQFSYVKYLVLSMIVSLLCHVQRRINSYLIVIHGHLKLMALSIGNVYISKSRFKYSRALQFSYVKYLVLSMIAL